MNMKSVWIVFFLLLPGFVFAQSKTIKTILRLQDLRVRPSSLAPYLKSNDPEVIERALIALGSIQDREAVPYISELIGNSNPSVRRAAAFALSQTGDTTVFPAIQERVINESDIAARLEFARAAGKLASLAEIETLLDSLELKNDVSSSAEILTRLSIRPLVSEKILEHGETLLGSDDDKILSQVTYALNRFKKPDNWFKTVEVHHERLAVSPSQTVRMGWASLLGSSQDTSVFNWIRIWLQKEISPQVRVNLIRSAGRIHAGPSSGQNSILVSVMNDPVPMVQMAAQISLMNLVPEKESEAFKIVSAALEGRLLSVSDPLSKTDIDWMILSAKMGLTFHEALLSKVENHPNPVLRAYQSVIYSETGNPVFFPVLRKLLEDESVPVKTLAGTALMNLSRKLALPARSIKTDIQKLVNSKDMALISVAGDVLAEKNFQYEGFEKDLVLTLEQLDPVEDVEAIQSILNTLGPVPGSEIDSVFGVMSGLPEPAISSLAMNWIRQRSTVDFSVRPLAQPQKPVLPDLTDLETVWKGMWFEIKTNKGTFFFELLPKEAPLTCLRMVEFAKKGYFDGLFFHRLVPNFVIQGGDPRGDGWGGPGIAMRSEFSPVKYAQEGMVGMASAGKDTEGSQFFIVHSATPHLDGRYTLWAKVVSGLSVVQQLEIGDRIESVKVLESLPQSGLQKEAKKGKRK